MRYYLTCILIIFLSFSSYAQEVVNLTGTWINLGLDLEWNDRIGFELSQSNRFNDIIGTFAVSNTTFKASYELNDWFKAIGGYRYTFREAGSRRSNRYQLALQARTKLKDLKLTWRTRFEYRKAINRDNQVTRLRNKASVSYRNKAVDLEPKIFVEYWYIFDEPLRNFSKYRIGISLTKEVNDRIDLRAGFNYDSDINQDELERESIALVALTYNFRRQKATK